MATKRLGCPAVVAILCLCSASIANADTGTSLGDRNGEGSTQFTGLAQAPEANLFTGALSTSIPIEVPPGRKGMTPELALRYSSSGGPSPYGYGWDLPIGRIERGTKHGVPRCSGNDDEFVLILPGTAAELVNEPGTNYYRPRIEQSYVRAEKFEAENKWVVHDRSGIKYIFGDLYSARAGTDPNFFEMQDPTTGFCHFTTTWALTSVEDPNGNTIYISWFTVANVPLPLYIYYGGNDPASLGALYQVELGWALRDPTDNPQSSRSGAQATLFYRLASITVHTLLPSSSTIRRYVFTYNDDDPDYEPDGYQSILTAIEVLGTSGNPVVPPQHFVYTPSVVGHGSGVSVSVPLPSNDSYIRKANSSGDVTRTLMDMNGDGLLDLVSASTADLGYWLVNFGSLDSNGTFSFAGQVEWTLPPGVLDDATDNIIRMVDSEPENLKTQRDTFDINGDGIPDYVDATASPFWTVYPGRMAEDGSWGFASDYAGDEAIPWPAPFPYIRWDKTFGASSTTETVRETVDMNGDGLPDYVYSDPNQAAPYSWQVYSTREAGSSPHRFPIFPPPTRPSASRTSISTISPSSVRSTTFSSTSTATACRT
jgi:Salmonella virulence plasmid 65kDa B protein